MTAKYHEHVQTHTTPQTEPVPGKPTIPNSAGGYSFAVDDWKRLERFLILGSEGGTYYVAEKQLTRENAACVERCALDNPIATVKLIEAISDSGRAPKNDPAVFALALCASVSAPSGADFIKQESARRVRQLALEAVPRVCRIGTHIFQFAATCNALRGWGNGLRKAVGKWYTSKDAEQLGYQLAKYQQRDGWSHRDLLRLAHVKDEAASTYGTKAALRWAVTGDTKGDMRTVTRGKGDKAVAKQYGGFTPSDLPQSIQALESLKKATSAAECVKFLQQFADKATREMVPTQFLTSREVWEVLLETMPMTAMLRNLGTMTRVGLLAPLSDAVRTVCERFRDLNRLKKARLHPLTILTALRTYAAGRGVKGYSTWAPVQAVVDALNDAFYLAFDAVEPTNKRWMFGIDVSASMSAAIAGTPVSCCEAATALALVSARIEPYTFTGAFNTGLREVPFGRTTRLDDALKHTRDINSGGTDCSLPMVYALQQKIPVDTFCVLTDSETYAGSGHAFQRLNEYRQKMGIPAKMIVAGMTSNGFTIADPSDAGMLDVVGFSTDVPALMADFARN